MATRQYDGYSPNAMRIGRGPILALVGVSLVAACLIGAPLAIEGMAQRKAAERGLLLQIGDVSLGLGHVRLRGLRLSHPRLAALDISLEEVEVGVGLSGAGNVLIVGGSARYAGALQDLKDKLQQPGSGERSEARRAGGRRIEVRGLAVTWDGPEGTSARLSGVELMRGSDEFTGSIENAEVRATGAMLRLESLAFAAGLSDSKLHSLTVRDTHVELEPPALLRAWQLDAPVSAVKVGKNDDTSQTSKARRNILQRWTVDDTRAGRLTGVLRDLVRSVSARLPDGAGLKLERIHAVLRFADSALTLGPARLTVSRRPEELFVELIPGYEAEDAKRVQLEAAVPLDTGDARLSVRGGPIALASLGVKKGDLGLSNPDAALLTVSAEARWQLGADEVRLQSRGDLDGVAVAHKGLAEYPLTGISLSWNGDGTLSLSGRHVVVTPSSLSLGAVAIEVEGELEREAERLRFSGKAAIPTASCQAMFDSLPNGLAPGLSGARLAGTFSWRGATDFDTDALSDMEVLWRMQNRCRFVDVPAEVDPRRFKHPFRLSVPDELGQMMGFHTGPGSPNWVALPDISKYLEAAVLVTEDGRFWSHHGFDQGAIQSAIRQNINAGHYVRGASTISMQLAKNLYLSRSKVLARKVEEALLTMLIEQELRKDQILELYLNVIEYAPGVFGAQQAAEYYFRSLPEELSVAQSFFLASMLPSPSRQRFTDEGTLTEPWAKYVRSLMRIAHKRGRISEDELTMGLQEALRFGERYVPSPSRPRPRDEAETF